MKTLVYFPGLGPERLLNIQRRYLEFRCRNKWKLVFFEPRWHTDEPYEQKWQRVVDCLSELDLSQTHIIGASAGGPLITRILSDFPQIMSATCISGKIKNAAGIGEPYRKRAPAIYYCVLASEKALKNSADFSHKVTVFRPIFDTVIPLLDMKIEGAKHKRVFAFEHTMGIAVALLFFFPKP